MSAVLMFFGYAVLFLLVFFSVCIPCVYFICYAACIGWYGAKYRLKNKGVLDQIEIQASHPSTEAVHHQKGSSRIQ